MTKTERIPSELSIMQYMHCGKCLEEMPPDESPKNWQRIQVGFSRLGIQVWCVRHNCNVMHVDFQGQQHPANTDL